MNPNNATKTGAASPSQLTKVDKELSSARVENSSTVRRVAIAEAGIEDLDRWLPDRSSIAELVQDDLYAQLGAAPASQANNPTLLTAATAAGPAVDVVNAAASAESVAAQAVATPALAGAEVAGMSLGTIGTAAGVLGLAAAAGGGGGGGGGGSKSDSGTAGTPSTSTPAAPTIDSVTGNDQISGAEIAAGVTVNGSGTAGAVLSVVWGTTTKSATVDSSGRWSVVFASSEIPATPGSSAISASVTTAGQTSAVTTHAVIIDAPAPNAPIAPSIDSVTSDNIVNAGERGAGVTVGGGGLALATVSITWGNITKTATVDAAGRWTSSFAANEIPAAEGSSTISAAQTRLGQTSATASHTLTVDTVAPATPTVLASATGIVSGTSTAGSKLTLDINADGVADAAVTAGANGSYAFATVVNNNQTVSVIAFDAAGNPSLAGSPAVPAAPTIAAVSTDNLINGTERAAGITITGTGLAGADVTVSWGSSGKTATVDGSGNWTSKFSSGEIPGGEGSSSISATETRFGRTSTAASQTVTMDTVAPAAPTISVNGSGIVSGKTDAGNKLTIDSNGDGVADATVIAASNGTFTFATAFTSGQSLVVSSFDAAGNKSASATTLAPSTNFGSAAADIMSGTAGADLLIGGSGADQISGGAGNDRLFGGSAASVRNYQFEYWDLRGGNASGIWDNGLPTAGNPAGSGNIAFLDTSAGAAGLGWSMVDYVGIASRTFGSGPSAETQWLGVPDNNATPLIDEHIPPLYQLRLTSTTGPFETPDTSGNGGRYLLASAIDPTQGGTEILQTVITNPNESYALRIHASNPELSNNSIVISWKGAELAVYDAITNTWSGTAPTITADGASHVNLSWNVTGQAAAGSSSLDIKVYSTLATTLANQRSLRIDSVTLDGTTVDGNDLLVGGAGQDILFGQAGDDTLYGGAAGAVDNSGNAFVYTMRTNNGNDVIKDFQVGSDRLTLIDLVDSYLGSGVWNSVSNPDASRTPDSIRQLVAGGPLVQQAGTINDADHNLSYQDLMLSTSANQYLSLSADGPGNNLKITLHNAAGELGSVVLEGVQYGTGAGQYDTVQDLMGSGYHDPNVLTPVGSPTQILFVTMEGYNPNLLV